MRSRLLVAALAIAAVIAVILWWRGRDRGQADDPSAAAGTASPAATAGGAPSTPGARPLRERPGEVAGPTRVDPPAGAASREGKTYVMDNGAVVQDHRTNPEPPIVPPGLPPSKQTMSPEITAKIYMQLKPAVAACGASVAADERGAEPFVYVTMTVAVAGGKLTTTDVYPTVHDLKGPTTDAFVDCVRKRGLEVSIEQSGEPDRNDYIVQYPLRLP